MFDKIEQALNSLRMMRPSSTRDEILKIATAIKHNQDLKDQNFETLKTLMSQMSSSNERLLEWGQEMKNCIDEYVRLTREKQQLLKRLQELKARL